MPLILEGIVTTHDANNNVNIAPMGPIVDESLTSFRFRPFQTSTTYLNLVVTRCGVFHVIDDVLLIAQAVTNNWIESKPELIPANNITGSVIANSCRSYEFRVTNIDASNQRSEIDVEILHVQSHRDFFGFNRAKHAVLELAILATRLHLLEQDLIESEKKRLRVILDKTAGAREQQAFHLLEQFIQNQSATKFGDSET